MRRSLFSLLLFLIIPSPFIVATNVLGEVYLWLEVAPISISEIHFSVHTSCTPWCAPIDYPNFAKSCVIYRDGKQINESCGNYDQNLSPNTTYCYSAKVTRESGAQTLLGPQCATTFAYYIVADGSGYGGSIWNGDIIPYGVVYVDAGSEQTFSIVPAQGYRIRDVLVDGKSVGAVKSYTFSNISANHSLEAISQKVTSINFLLQLLLDD
jgi:hypothetical protein